MQNSVITTWFTSLHGSQPSRVVFRCKTATYGPEKQVSMGPRLDLSLCTCTTMWLATELLGSMGLSLHLLVLHAKQRLLDQCTSLYGCQTSPVVLCMQKSVICTRIKHYMGCRSHLWFLHAKQRLLDQNNKSLWVPDFTCDFLLAKQRA